MLCLVESRTGLHGEFLLEARSAIEETVHHLVLWRIGSLTSKAAAHLATWPSSDESVSLQSLVILDVLLELAQGIPRRRALGTSHERHDAGVSSTALAGTYG